MARERKSLIETGSILPGPDILSRVIARDRDQSGRATPPPLDEADNTSSEQLRDPQKDADNITGNMISNTNDHIAENNVSQTVDQAYDLPVIRAHNRAGTKTAKRQIERTDEPASLLSAANSIRQSFVNPAVRVRYNAVTFKIHPNMEEWVNSHVRKTGRMKQDVLNDALTLYRNLVEEVMPEPQGEKGEGAKK